MKILLIYPYFLEERLNIEEIQAVPLGLYYVGAMLRAHGYDVQILNWHAMQNEPNAIKEALIAYRPKVIGFSIMHANRWGGIDIARMAKALDPQVTIAFGGIGATFLWEHFLAHFPEIDYVVLGEGEYTFLNLVRAIESDQNPQEAGIRGLALRVHQRIVQTPPATPIEELDGLPQPARYFDFHHLVLTRGCPSRCTFCGSPRFWGRQVRAHSADYFVDQLTMLAERGITFFYISDDTFTLDSELVIDVCRKIIERKLKIVWQAISKVNAVNETALFWMRKAGCIQISFGVESGSPEIRRRLCKDIGSEQIRRAFDLTVRHGILARAYFIYGAPGETGATINQTLALIDHIRPLSAIFYILDIFPGTALYEEFKVTTGADDDIWLQRIEDILCFESDPALDAQTVRAFGRRLRNAYKQRLPEFAKSIVLKDDPALWAEQADFLSRLGMTFSHGDYAQLKTKPSPWQAAQDLFRRALTLYPDERAFWGLALVLQQLGEWNRSMAALQDGLQHYPHSQILNICLGVCHIHMNQYDQALQHLLPFKKSAEARPHIERCYRALDRNNPD